MHMIGSGRGRDGPHRRAPEPARPQEDCEMRSCRRMPGRTHPETRLLMFHDTRRRDRLQRRKSPVVDASTFGTAGSGTIHAKARPSPWSVVSMTSVSVVPSNASKRALVRRCGHGFHDRAAREDDAVREGRGGQERDDQRSPRGAIHDWSFFTQSRVNRGPCRGVDFAKKIMNSLEARVLHVARRRRQLSPSRSATRRTCS